MRDVLATAAVYLAGSLAGPVVVGIVSSLSSAVLLLMLVFLLLAGAAGEAARRAGRPEAHRLRAAAGVCLGTFVAVLAGLALLTRADNAAEQVALLAPIGVGLLVLLPAAAFAEAVARRKPGREGG